MTFTGVEGNATAPTTLIGSFTDPDKTSTIASYTVLPGSIVVELGDGTPSSPDLQFLTAANLTEIGEANGNLFQIMAAHIYKEEGQYSVSITVTKQGIGGPGGAPGAVTILTATAVIADAVLTTPLTPQPTINTTESAIFPLPAFSSPIFNNQPVATFIDLNPTAPLSDFTVSIDWGDGTANSVGSVTQPGGVGTPFIVSGSHTYASSGVNGGVGVFPVIVYITDVGGSKLTIANVAHVADIPLVVTGNVNESAISGQSTGTADVTNNNQPDFEGTSQPFSHVNVFATPTGGLPTSSARPRPAATARGTWFPRSPCPTTTTTSRRPGSTSSVRPRRPPRPPSCPRCSSTPPAGDRRGELPTVAMRPWWSTSRTPAAAWTSRAWRTVRSIISRPSRWPRTCTSSRISCRRASRSSPAPRSASFVEATIVFNKARTKPVGTT